MDRTSLLLIIAGIVIGIVIAVLILRPRTPLPSIDPIVTDAGNITALALNPLPKEPSVEARPRIEYPNAAASRSLVKTPYEIHETTNKASPRPLIEYSNSVISMAFMSPAVSLLAIPRPLIEYSNSAAVFALEQPTNAGFSQVQPRPLVEYVGTGWIKNLSPPTELLQMGK